VQPVKFDLKEFYEKYKEEFKEWLYKKISKDTANKYLKAIDDYLPSGISEPKDLAPHVTKTKYLPLGIRNFLNFLEYQYYMTELAGFSFDIWRKYLPTKTGKKKGGKKYITDKHIKQAYKLIKEKWKDPVTEDLFKLMVYSGICYEHAYKLFKTFDPKKLVFENSFAMYPIEELTGAYEGEGTKEGYMAFMPAEFARKLERPKKMLSVGSYKGRLNPGS